MENTKSESGESPKLLDTIRAFFDLKSDTDEQGTIDQIRANVDFKSANAWTLVFAIFLASVGLNTNSSAVVIGAMLISPLMGPIVGAGLGLGINDFKLLRRSVRNLLFAMAIGLIASTTYFLISPLSEVQSELLARTRPTFFDVLIAVFGGAAGIVALSRQEKGNAIPGVAIATALMPPLCTAGFGLATLEFSYFFGAIYLFVINCVFIAITTYVFVRYLKFPKVAYATVENRQRLHRTVFAVATVVIVPSLILAWLLQNEVTFRSKANSYLQNEMKFTKSFMAQKEIDYSWEKEKVRVSLVGEKLSEDQLTLLKEKARRYGIAPESVEIQQISVAESLEMKIDEKMTVQQDLKKQLEMKLAQAELALRKHSEDEELARKVSRELGPLFPDFSWLILQAEKTEGRIVSSDESQFGVYVRWKRRPNARDRKKLSDFLMQRLSLDPAAIHHSVDI